MFIFYILAALAVLLLLMLLFAVIRSISIKAIPYFSEPANISMEDQIEYAKGLQKLIMHKTVASNEKTNLEPFFMMQKEMETLFPNVHKRMEKHVFPGGSLLFKWKGKSDQNPLVLMAHQDVVPAS